LLNESVRELTDCGHALSLYLQLGVKTALEARSVRNVGPVKFNKKMIPFFHHVAELLLPAPYFGGAMFRPVFVMAALRRRCGHYIFAMWFLLSFFFSFVA